MDFTVRSITAIIAASFSFQTLAQDQQAVDETIKFALFSAAWGENTDDGLKVVVQNLSEQSVRLERIDFLDLPEKAATVELELNLELPANKYAQRELAPVDLLSGDDCVARTMAENWKLVEISNYTLNPSVRNLIIEDTNSFRIYQCVRSVRLHWLELSDHSKHESEGWVLYHFESRSDG